MRLSTLLKRLLGIVIVIFTLLLCWSFAYWGTPKIYAAFHLSPDEFVRQLVNSVLGFLIFGFLMQIITIIPWVRNRQGKILVPIIQAMKMMSEGNFNIDLSFYLEQFRNQNDRHPYYQIIKSISHMADKLGQMEEMRQEFISNVSHEIQSPLTSISGFAHALKNDTLRPEERNHYLEIIEMESMRLSKLSENLLKLTSLESEHLPVELKNYRLDRQLRRIILANEPQWLEKEIHMDISLENLILKADEELMDQVWINLLHNSIKFTPHKGTITIEAFETADNEIIVKMKDTGIGMDEDTRMHIFERFFKADQSRNRNSGGNGLGLSIVKKIIDLHKGKIHVQSELGKGTEISVSLKLSN